METLQGVVYLVNYLWRSIERDITCRGIVDYVGRERVALEHEPSIIVYRVEVNGGVVRLYLGACMTLYKKPGGRSDT
jgi:hypothetical protein